MTKFFVGLYNYFERHKVLFYLSLSVCILFMALFAAQVRFEENVTSFFPDTKDSQNAINVFENLKIKDKIMIMLSGKDGVADADSLIEAAETIKQDLQQQAEGTLIKEIFSKADENLINSVGDFGLSGNFWLVSFKISYLCLPLFYETRTTPSCHPSGCAYRQL